MINYTAHRAALELMYEDKAAILRYTETKKPSRETVLSVVPVPVYSDKSCKLSQISLARNDQSEAQNDIKYPAKLFIAPELVIMQGDIIEVTRAANGQVYRFTAGEPFPPYSSHQEIDLLREGYA